MTRFCPLLPVFVLLSMAMRLAAAEAVLASGKAGAISWEVSCPFDSLPEVGFVPVTVTASVSGSRASQASYEIKSSQGYYGGGATTLAAGSLTLPVGKPDSSTHWIWRRANYRNEFSNSFVSFSITSPSGNSSDTLSSGADSGSHIAVSDTLVKAESSNLRERGNRFSHIDNGISLLVFEPDSLPADWRIFSSLRAVCMTPTDWDELSPGVRDAMRTWIGFGGLVRIFSVNREDRERVVNELTPSGAAIGVFASPDPVKAMHFSQFGPALTDIASSSRLVFQTGVPDSDVSRRNPYSRNRGWTDDYGNRIKNDFPLRDDFGTRTIPYFIICMLLILFAIIVGPVSLYLWAGPGRRHRLFFTVPAFSLATSGLLLLVMLFQDGLGIDGRRFVILDLATANTSQTNAIVYQEQFSRAGMTGGGGFDLEDGLLPLLPMDGMQEKLSVRDGKAVGSWFASRRDRSIALAGAVPVRWQVTHEGAGETSLRLRVESPITKFEEAWFVDGDEQIWGWDGNQPDGDGVYTFIPKSHDPGVMASMFANCSEVLGNSVLATIGQPDQRNRFWALAEDAGEAARETNPKIDWIESTLVLTSKVVPKS